MKKYKLIFIGITAVLLTAGLMMFTDTVSQSVTKSLKLCYSSVIPALFPFFAVCEIITAVISSVGKNIPIATFATGLISGYPTGVKNVCMLYTDKAIDKKTACALLHCTANASPAYVVAFIGICILKNKIAGIILLAAQTTAAVACAVFYGCFSKRIKHTANIHTISLTEILCSGVANSVIGCLYVCGYIIFFGIIADIIIKTGVINAADHIFFFMQKTQAHALLAGFFEITRGMVMLDIGEKGAMLTAAVMLAFSGISVIMQCASAAIDAKLPIAPLIEGKIAYILIMPITVTCFSKLFDVHSTQTAPDSALLAILIFLIFILCCIFSIYYIFDKHKNKRYNKKGD